MQVHLLYPQEIERTTSGSLRSESRILVLYLVVLHIVLILLITVHLTLRHPIHSDLEI